MEWYISWFFVFVYFVALFFWLRKQPLKDWIIVYLLRVFINVVIDSFVVAYDLIQYPVRFLPHVFQITVLFDFMIYPTLCVIFNLLTYRSNIKDIVLKAVVLSGGMTILEIWFEKNTDLITYHNWTFMYTFITLTLCFFVGRTFIAIVRHYSREKIF